MWPFTRKKKPAPVLAVKPVPMPEPVIAAEPVPQGEQYCRHCHQDLPASWFTGPRGVTCKVCQARYQGMICHV